MVGFTKLGLVNLTCGKNSGWLYTGKVDSKAINFYKHIYCNNDTIGIPIEDDGILGHFEEGYDNQGNLVSET